MKPKTMILMVVAVVCGLGASYMTSRLLAEREDQQPTTRIVEKEIERMPILVAKKNLELCTLVKSPRDLFEERKIPKDEAFKDAVADWKVLEGKTLRRQIGKGRHVTAEDLADGAPVLEIPPGHRGLGLSVTVHTTAGGWATLPGSRVDIIWTRRGNNDDNTFSKTLLQNVLVLAADGNKNPGAENGAIVASVVTLALTPDDVRRVSNAADNGTLRLVVRTLGDNSIAEETITTLKDTLAGNTRRPDAIEDEQPPEPVKAIPSVDDPRRPVPEIPVEQPNPRRTHVVWHRDGPKQWKEVFFLDDDGNVIVDDVQRDEKPQVGAQPQTPPGPTPPATPSPSLPGPKE